MSTLEEALQAIEDAGDVGWGFLALEALLQLAFEFHAAVLAPRQCRHDADAAPHARAHVEHRGRQPHRLRAIVTTLAFSLVVWGVITLLIAGIREHGS